MKELVGADLCLCGVVVSSQRQTLNALSASENNFSCSFSKSMKSCTHHICKFYNLNICSFV